MPLKRKPLARGKCAPRASSIVDGFCPQPWLGSVADSAVPLVCTLALVAARAPLEVIRGDAQNGSTLATIPDGRASVRTAETSPTCDVPELRRHDGWSDSPTR